MSSGTAGQVSASQLVGMFGPGAIVNLETVSVMPESPHRWWWKSAISSPTFARQIGASDLIDCSAMSAGNVPARLFPNAFVCSSCGRIAKVRMPNDKELDRGFRCAIDGERMHPSRWIVFCSRGHIDDVDYLGFVHGANQCPKPDVRLVARATVTSSEVICACGTRRPLQEAYSWVKGRRCTGNRPWEGDREDACGEKVKLSMRSASDVYFGAVRSAISIEPETKRSVRTVFKLLSAVAGRINNLSDGLEFLRFHEADLKGFTSDDISMAIDAFLSAKADPGAYEDRRYQEFVALSRGCGGPSEDLWVEEVVGSDLEFAGVGRVMAVRKLREVRALVGFQRGSIPPDPTFEHEASQELSVRFRDVVPAYENRGEGIFFEFQTAKLRKWLGRAQTSASVDRFKKAEERWRFELSRDGATVSRGLYVLAHSFAHLVIRELALDCGYSQAALRERVFASADDADVPWAGVLIYTSSSDADGSLGGLVFQAIDRRLGAIVRRGHRDLAICSSDPVCALQEPKGFRKLNGAACHSCLVLPETSCERNNAFLDRNIVVPGTLRDPLDGLYFGA